MWIPIELMTEQKREKARVVLFKSITAPLGFFVFSLLIAETFLGSVLLGGSLSQDLLWRGLCLGAGLFVVVIVIVAVMVWFKPDHLTYDMEAHLRDRGKPPFGTESGTASAGPSSEKLTPTAGATAMKVYSITYDLSKPGRDYSGLYGAIKSFGAVALSGIHLAGVDFKTHLPRYGRGWETLIQTIPSLLL